MLKNPLKILIRRTFNSIWRDVLKNIGNLKTRITSHFLINLDNCLQIPFPFSDFFRISRGEFGRGKGFGDNYPDIDLLFEDLMLDVCSNKSSIRLWNLIYCIKYCSIRYHCSDPKNRFSVLLWILN